MIFPWVENHSLKHNYKKCKIDKRPEMFCLLFKCNPKNMTYTGVYLNDYLRNKHNTIKNRDFQGKALLSQYRSALAGEVSLTQWRGRKAFSRKKGKLKCCTHICQEKELSRRQFQGSPLREGMGMIICGI